MKKKACFLLASFTIFVTNANAGFLEDAFNWLSGQADKIMKELFVGLNQITADTALSTCYVPDPKSSSGSKDIDICGYLNVPDIDMCSIAPDLPGYKKKDFTFKGNDYLKSLCNNATKKAQSAISDIDIFGDIDGNRNDSDLDKKYTTKEILSNSIAPARKAFLQGNQNELRLLISQSQKDGSVSSIQNIKVEDLKAPADFSEYRKERNTITDFLIEDYVKNAPDVFGQDVRQKVVSIEDSQRALDVATNKAHEDQRIIDTSTNKRIQTYLDIYAKPDDYAIPTQEMVDLLTDEAKIEAIAKIKQQLKREALIMAELKQIDNSRKNILNIVAKKAVVISRPFPSKKVTEEIDALIKDTNGGSGGSSPIP